MKERAARGPCVIKDDTLVSTLNRRGRHYRDRLVTLRGGGPRVVVSTAAFHARVRGSVPGLGGLKETKLFLPHPRVKVSIVGSLRDREVACSASDRQGSNFESCVWRTVSSQSSHHPQEVLLAQFSLYVHKGGLKPDSFHLVTLRREKQGYFSEKPTQEFEPGPHASLVMQSGALSKRHVPFSQSL